MYMSQELSDLKKLRESVEFIRTKHQKNEALSFFEICEAVDILHVASKVSTDPFVEKVVKKNTPYLQKLLKEAMELEYRETLGKCLDLSTDKVLLEHSNYSGITDFKISIIEEELIILLNSNKDRLHTIIVPIQNTKLEIEALHTQDQIYVSDMIDMPEMINILEKNSIDYLHIVETGIYKMIDAWDNTRTD